MISMSYVEARGSCPAEVQQAARCREPPDELGRTRQMNLAELVPDAAVLLALDPDELGLHILHVLRTQPAHQAT